ncbi:MAG: sulfite reductase subunit alpha [Hyphomicrobium sp.]
MTIQQPAPQPVPLIPETAPFSTEQRAWLNGFFAGLLSLDHHPGAVALTGVPDVAANALRGDGDDGETPWHDPAMAIGDRMALADGKPVRRRMFAAMAQQNCGQCGYLCEDYANKLAAGEEARPNLCVPGGKETSRMLKMLLEDLSSGGVALDQPATPMAPPAASPAPTGAPGYSREQPVACVFKSATLLNSEGSEKDTRHVVFDITQSGVGYEPGDSFGLMPANCPNLVDAVLASMKAPPDFPIGGKTLRATLLTDYALGIAPDMMFEFASYMVGGARRQKLKALAKGQDPDGDAATYDVLKVLETFGPMHPDPEAFLECLEPLQPRLYSISSSPLATPGELHLTVDAVRYAIDARRRLGVASTFLADRVAPGAEIQVYVQKAHGFALPVDPTTPIIMVGPGTGVAPFRSFLWHRQAQRASGKAWLFFGHQREASDFYYRDEFTELQKSGALTRLTTAWSRDGANKVYVQDRMRESGEELWAWLKAGAHFYVCGDAKRMAKDVEAALVDIASAHGRLSGDAARTFVADLKRANRYQADVY